MVMAWVVWHGNSTVLGMRVTPPLGRGQGVGK